MKNQEKEKVMSAIKPGDTVTVRGTVTRVDSGSDPEIVVAFRKYVSLRVSRDLIVDHTPKPAPQCRSLIGAGPGGILWRCRLHGDDHHDHIDRRGHGWKTSQESGRFTPRGEQSGEALMGESIVCLDYPDCDRAHAGGAGGVPVHPPAGARISGDEPLPGYSPTPRGEQS